MFTMEINGSSCEVKDLSNKLIAVGVIRTVDNALEVQDITMRMPILKLNSWVKLCVRGRDGKMVVLAGQVYISNRRFLRVVEVQSMADREKRRFFRLSIDHSATLFFPAADPAANQSEHPEEGIPVRVKDISLCGMLIQSSLEFETGSRMQVQMTLNQNRIETIDLVIRREADWDNKSRYYGCEIVDMPSRVEQGLCVFIMREQQEQIRRSRNR